MDPFIEKLREYGLALRCNKTNTYDLDYAPLFNSDTSPRMMLYYLTTERFNIYVNNEDLFKEKFQLDSLFGERPSFFLEFFYLEYNFEHDALKLYNDTYFPFTDEIIGSYIQRNIEQYQLHYPEFHLKSLFNPGFNFLLAVIETIVNEINHTCFSPLLIPHLAQLETELLDILESTHQYKNRT